MARVPALQELSVQVGMPLITVHFMQGTVQSRKEGYNGGKGNENRGRRYSPLRKTSRNKQTNKQTNKKKRFFFGNVPVLPPPSHFLPNHLCSSLHQAWAKLPHLQRHILLTDISMAFPPPSFRPYVFSYLSDDFDGLAKTAQEHTLI